MDTTVPRLDGERKTLVREPTCTYITRTGAVRALISAGLSGPRLRTLPIRTQ